MKNRILLASICFVVGTIILCPVILLMVTFMEHGEVLEINSDTHYGIIDGNYNNDKPREFIFSFFPEELQDDFSDIVYHYKAKKGDTYAFECYLEFVIEDETAYRKYVKDYTDSAKTEVFMYEDSYMEYTISNVLFLDWTSGDNRNGYSIGMAEIGKVLYCDEEQRVIFWAMGMHDGGGASTKELGYFFNRFHIDVIAYQLNAFYSWEDQERGITYNERYALGLETPYPYPK